MSKWQPDSSNPYHEMWLAAQRLRDVSRLLENHVYEMAYAHIDYDNAVTFTDRSSALDFTFATSQHGMEILRCLSATKHLAELDDSEVDAA